MIKRDRTDKQSEIAPNKRSLVTWDIFQLKLARQYATMSKDPSTRCGAIVTTSDSKYVLGMGYNGFPPNVEDSDELLCDRVKKYPLMVHAEKNALNQALKIRGAMGSVSLFVYPFLPCSSCAKMIEDYRSYGLAVTRVVTLAYAPERWKGDFLSSEAKLLDLGIEVVKYSPSLLTENETYALNP